VAIVICFAFGAQYQPDDSKHYCGSV